MQRWSIDTKVAGVTFEGRQKFVVFVNAGDWLRVMRDAHNPHDPNACGVWRVDERGNLIAHGQVGFVPRTEAVQAARSIAEGYDVWAIVTEVVGGFDEGSSVGLRISLRRRLGSRAIPRAVVEVEHEG